MKKKRGRPKKIVIPDIPLSTVRERANYAKQLTENPLLMEIFSTLKKEALEQWADMVATDVAGREFMWTYVKVLHQVLGRIQGCIEEGTLEEAKNLDFVGSNETPNL